MVNKIIKLIITFLVLFNISFINVYAENETNATSETNSTEVKEDVLVSPNTEVDPAHVKELVNGNYLVIQDDAKLLNDNELILLREQMQSLTEFGNIIFLTTDTAKSDTYKYATDYYYNNFGNGSGTLFIIDMYTRYLYIVSEGWNYTIITRAKSEIITDNIYYYASQKRYYECAKRAYNQIETLLRGGKINEPMRYASNIVLSLVAGFFITFLYVIRKSKIKIPSNSDILSNCDIDFNVKSINVESAGQHKVYSPQSDSSSSGGHSSGGGGFSGGGGGFSGGGGGHRF